MKNNSTHTQYTVHPESMFLLLVALETQALPTREQLCVCSLCEKLQYEDDRSEEHTSELQSHVRISYAVFCLKKKKPQQQKQPPDSQLETSNTQTRCSKKTII